MYNPLAAQSLSSSWWTRTQRVLQSLDFPTGIAIFILGGWIVAAALAPLIAPHGESAIVGGQSFAGPTWSTWLGTDNLGRDVLSRLLYGARLSLILALASTLLAFVLGVVAGFSAALLGTVIDNILSRINDIFLSFPSLMLALIVISGLGSNAIILVMTVGFIEAVRVFRVSRSLGMNISSQDFVLASKARGEGLWWILRREILPNSIGPLSTDFGLRFTYAILLMSALSFLGLGVQPPSADLGSMVRENMAGLAYGAPAALAPAIAIFSIAVGINLLVDWNVSRSTNQIPKELVK